MKKLLYTLATIIAIFGATSSFSMASSIENEFSYNEIAIEKAFEAVQPLESVIVNNFENADLNFVTVNHSQALAPVATILNLNPNSPMDSDKNPILGIPSFLWGMCLGVIGIVVVAVVGDDLPKDERQAQVKKSAIGCAVGYGAAALIYFVLLGGVLAAA